MASCKHVDEQARGPSPRRVLAGSRKAILGTVSTDASCGGQFDITENHRRIIVPHPCSSEVGVYSYPTGGAELKNIDGLSQPSGAALSVANP